MKNPYEWGAELPRLTGKRLELSGLTQRDAPAIFEIFGDPEVVRYWSSPPFTELSEANKLITETRELFKSRQLFQWGVRLRESGKVIGTCTLYQWSQPHARAEIGFALGSSSWGQRLATEAVELLIGFSFEALEVRRLEADVDPRNEASLRLLEGQGFQREGLLRERWRTHGEADDAVFLGLLRREWAGGSARGGE